MLFEQRQRWVVLLDSQTVKDRILILEIQRRQYEGHNTPLGYHTDQGRGQNDGQGKYFGLSTASEAFLIFTTQLCSCSYNCNAIGFISSQEGSIATGILPTPSTSLSSLPMGSKALSDHFP